MFSCELSCDVFYIVACRNVLDQALLVVPAEDSGLLGSHMVGTVRTAVVRAQTRDAPSAFLIGRTVWSLFFIV